MIRPMTRSDVASVVDIHMRSFPGFFLTFLGRSFLTELYEGIREDPEGLVLVADETDGPVGFVAGTLHQGGFYRRLLERRKWKFARAAAGALLRKPGIAGRLLRALNRPADADRAAASACLMSIAVAPAISRKGVGRELVEAFCRELGERGARNVSLTTDRDDNERVNEFYRRLGFRLARSYETPEGRPMNEYVRDIPT
jgi:ribosomal protein S18 acetylase RimI-like enzyme